MTAAEIIDSLGGDTKVAELLNYPRLGGAQRVHNWRERGIPARVKVERPDLFMRGLGEGAADGSPTPQVGAHAG